MVVFVVLEILQKSCLFISPLSANNFFHMIHQWKDVLQSHQFNFMVIQGYITIYGGDLYGLFYIANLFYKAVSEEKLLK